MIVAAVIDARFALKAAASLAAAIAVMRQCRRPAWLPGRFLLWSMNRSHAALTKWGLGHVAIEPTDVVLDVGCGGGRTVSTMASAASRGRVVGVDYSATSVAVARRVNAAAIDAGRVMVEQASVSALPFPAGTFDLATAVETHYYWPDLHRDLGEIRRVLKPGGRVALIAEAYRGRRADWVYRPAMHLLQAKYLTADEHRRALEGAGYTDVHVHTETSKGWLCVVGRNPVASTAGQLDSHADAVSQPDPSTRSRN